MDLINVLVGSLLNGLHHCRTWKAKTFYNTGHRASIQSNFQEILQCLVLFSESESQV